MGWPQIVWIALTAMGLGCTAVKHGQPKEGNENFWTSLIANGIVALLLYYGGFFG